MAAKPLPGTVTHGRSRSPEYRAWADMLDRCTNPNNAAWESYGGRGITVCAAWASSFENFYADMGVRPPGLELDREKNHLGYSKENCRWVTHEQNCRNRRTNVTVFFRGERRTLQEISEITGIDATTIGQRVKAGTSEEALAAPTKKALVVVYQGASMGVQQAATASGIPYHTLRQRISKAGQKDVFRPTRNPTKKVST